MLGLKKFLFKNASPAHLPEDIKLALDSWRSQPATSLEEAHFHSRYVVIDIASTGMNPETDELLGVAAAAVRQSTILPDDAMFLDVESASDGDVLDRQLVALLQFSARSPLVTYHVSYVGGFLQRLFKERLGVDFQPQWVDLAWLLPALFADKSSSVMPLDQWIAAFGLDEGSSRRSAMENTLMLARIFQMLLVRANGKGIDTAAKLIDESRASSFLRRTH